MARIELTVDGAKVSDDVEPRMLLVQYLREKLGKTGTVIGCDTSNCGACTVHLDGRSVKSCNVLAVQASGHEVTTIEGLADTHEGGDLHPVQEAFRECHGLQCGFCTPGMIMQAVDLLAENPTPTEAEVREGMEGNLCRCTGYHNIVKSVLHASSHAPREVPGDRRRGPPGHRVRQGDRARPPPQGGPAPHHRPHPLDRQHRAAGHAAPGDGPQPLRARQDRLDRHRGREGLRQRRGRAHRRRPRRGPGRLHQRLGDHHRPGHPAARADARATGSPSPARPSPSWSPARMAAARDAAELVDVEYDELPAALDLKKAAADEVLAHPDLGTNKSAFWKFDSEEAGTGGNVDAGHREGPRRRHRHRARVPPAAPHPGVHGAPLDRRRPDRRADHHVVGDPDPAHPPLRPRRHHRRARVQDPGHRARRGRRLRRQAPADAGGDDHLRGGPPARQAGEVHRDPLGVPDGRPPRARPVAEAHPVARRRTAPSPASRSSSPPTWAPTSRIVGGGVPVLGAFMFNAIYKFPAYQFNCQTVLTNKTWTDAYRGAGRPEATYAIERLMDELAAEVGVDPLVVREKNWITHEEFPFTTVAGLEYDTGNYEAATEKAKASFGYDELRAEQQRRREAGDRVQLGIGVSTFTEMCGLAPSRVLGSLNYGAGGWEYASVRMLATGKVEITTGTSAHGQGHETAFSQIVADRLGVAVRGRRDPARRHPDLAPRPRHLRLALAGRRRRGARPGGRQGDREGQAHRGAPARGLGRRHRVQRGSLRGPGHRPGPGDGRDRDGRLRGAQPARRRRGEPRQRRDVRPGQLQLPPRHAPVRDGGRHRDRRRADAQVHLRRRHRHRSSTR